MIAELQIISLGERSQSVVDRLLTADPMFVLERLDPHTREPKITYMGFGGTSTTVNTDCDWAWNVDPCFGVMGVQI